MKDLGCQAKGFVLYAAVEASLHADTLIAGGFSRHSWQGGELGALGDTGQGVEQDVAVQVL